MAESALVLCVLVVFLVLAPQIHTVWVHHQNVAAEANRDALDKTAGPLHWPEPRTSTFFGQISADFRGHPYPKFPPPPHGSASTDQWETVLGIDDNNWALIGDDKEHNSPPDAKSYLFGYYEFEQGFPNQYVEGWKWERFRFSGGWIFGATDMEATRYAAVIRSPWTWLGWPFIPTQDIWWERAQISAFWDNIKVDDDVHGALKLLADELPGLPSGGGSTSGTTTSGSTTSGSTTSGSTTSGSTTSGSTTSGSTTGGST